MYVKLFYAGELEDLEKKVNKYLFMNSPRVIETKYVDLPGYNASILLTCEGEEPTIQGSAGGNGKNSYYCACHNCPSRTTRVGGTK